MQPPPSPTSAPAAPAALLDPAALAAALAARLPAAPRTRFAPSPTGYLHLGHVANAVWVWGLARALGGRVLLRLEDHDRGRCRPEYEAALLDDLDWLGLLPDEPATDHFRTGAPSPYRQSDNDAVYDAALARLAGAYAVYACACSRREIARLVPTAAHAEPHYPGTCRTRGLAREAGRGVRLVLAPGEERFVDGVVGAQAQAPAEQCGDLLLRDRLGQWTYQFAVVVDDLRHGVDLVVRGQDLLASTGRQIRLARMLGRDAPPVFAHHPLILKPSGDKLSKASGDTALRELRAAGATPERVLGEAAWRTGLLAAMRPVEAGEVGVLFRG
ncbi:MAG TPA: glutamate--tRNA ligase family protein [Gemmatimonadales bacterium]|nr:glutamate--tRNA ligase family protein [Gemmatimonadales bacterium]